MESFHVIQPEELDCNPFKAIGKDWMLITAANNKDGAAPANPMTASWGGVGILWKKPVAFVFIRPQRFTRELIDAADTFSLTFFDERYREQLNLCGSKSGRDIDKIAACGFEVLFDAGTPYFAQAHTAVFCKKLYRQKLEADLFIDRSINSDIYPNQDHHFLYVGEITRVLTKNSGTM